MKLYSYWRSSCSWRVRIALAYKEIDYEYVPVHLVKDGGEQHQEDYLALNHMAQVPTLSWEEAGDTRVLTQSLAILHYLERTYPEPALLPSEPHLAARAIALAELINAGIQPLQNLATLQELKARGLEAKPFGREMIRRGFVALEAELASEPGDFCVGDEPTWADLCLVPQLYNARRFDVELETFPRILEVESRCFQLAPFLDAHPDVQPDAPPPTT